MPRENRETTAGSGSSRNTGGATDGAGALGPWGGSTCAEAGDKWSKQMPATPGSPKCLPVATYGARQVLAQWERVVQHVDGARADEDVEDVHKARVALRRLRAALRVFGREMERAAGTRFRKRLDANLREVARALGVVRDLDVAIGALAAYAEKAPPGDRLAIERLQQGWAQRRAAVQDTLRAALDDSAIARLQEQIDAALQSLAAPSREPMSHLWQGPTIGDAGTTILIRALRRFRRRGRALLAPSPEDLHALRIEAKRLRYTAEFLEPVLGSATAPLLSLMTAIQDRLGEVHDAEVAIGTLLTEIEHVAGDTARAGDAAAYARLIETRRRQRDASLGRFRMIWMDVPRPRTLRRTLMQG